MVEKSYGSALLGKSPDVGIAAEIAKAGFPAISAKLVAEIAKGTDSHLFLRAQTGRGGGTYACRELVPELKPEMAFAVDRAGSQKRARRGDLAAQF